MTNEEIHNIYLHMTGKAEGIAEAIGTADFPVLFARAILEFNRMEREAEKQEPVIDKTAAIRIATALGWEPKREWVGLTDKEIQDSSWHHFVTNQWPTVHMVVRKLEAKLKEKNT